MKMAELKEELGQVWTPDYIVEKILDDIEYTSNNSDILNKKIMEPSFGAGVFLFKTIERLIKCAQNSNKTIEEVSEIINENIYGIEYDFETYTSTVNNIKRQLSEKHQLECALPHLYNMDTLDYDKISYFDYVIGNPPYIRIHDMPAPMRKKVKTYTHSTGNSDLYITFFEIGLNMLNENGKLAYITPNSWLRNTSQKGFRKTTVQQQQVKKIVNFNAEQFFGKVGTYTCISYMSKKPNKKIEYIDASKNLNINYTRIVPYTELSIQSKNSDNILAFSSNDDQIFLNNVLHKETASLGELCRIQNSLLTLGNKYFLIDDNNEKYKNLGIDDLVHSAVKGTTYKGSGNFERMIFPYRKNNRNNKFEGITEEQLKGYPEACEILSMNRLQLENRSLEKDSLWFWYRSQSIQETDKRKIVFSPVISPSQTTIKTYVLPANTLVYSGLFITENDTDLFSNNLSIPEIQEIIESEDFLKYCRIVGKDMSGGYKSVSSSMVKRYRN